MCASPAIDAIFVASPDALHMQDTLLALAHDKPVLCEKPLAMNAIQVEQMLLAARRAKVLFGVAQNFRYNRSVNLIRKWIEDGKIGKPIFATAQFHFDSERSPRKWIYDASVACGGAIGDVGIHCLDALRFILNDDPIAVSTLARSDGQSQTVEASAALMIDFAYGTLGSVLVSFRSPYRTLIEIVGETGMIQSENGLTVDQPVEVLLRQKGDIVERKKVSNSDAYSRMLDAFSRAIAGDGDYAATGEDGLKNQLALDAAYASWRSGRKELLGAKTASLELP
jgi:1,5-anhydro-D-fructose reductase (1,5-anhydro-D-mannitol-forming)